MPTKKELLHYQGPYGLDVDVSMDFIRHETLASRSKSFDWEIQEHVHADLIQLFWITSGSGEIKTSTGSWPLSPPCLIYIPSHTLHGFTFLPTIEGEVFTFSTVFFDNIASIQPHLARHMGTFQQIRFDLEDSSWLELVQIKNRLVRELEEEQLGKPWAIQTLFHWLFLNIIRRLQEIQGQEIVGDHRALRYFQDFQKNIKRSYQESKSIAMYARDLQITPVHLNRLCRQVVGKSALHVVHEFLVQQAKTYLRGTDYSIAEIAYFLNLKDPAYFTRFFKRSTGQTPSDFRLRIKKDPNDQSLGLEDSDGV